MTESLQLPWHSLPGQSFNVTGPPTPTEEKELMRWYCSGIILDTITYCSLFSGKWHREIGHSQQSSWYRVMDPRALLTRKSDACYYQLKTSDLHTHTPVKQFISNISFYVILHRDTELGISQAVTLALAWHFSPFFCFPFM